jgi:hypothetical protein
VLTISKILIHILCKMVPANAPLSPCRQIRLAQLKEAAKKPKYGTVRSILRDAFVREVTEASRDCWVVVLLDQEKWVLLDLPLSETLSVSGGSSATWYRLIACQGSLSPLHAGSWAARW